MAVRQGTSIDVIPKLLKRVLEQHAWEERRDVRTKEVYRFDSFAEFVTTRPLAGLGTTVDMVRRLVVDDVETLDLFEQAVQNAAAVHNRYSKRPHGTTADTALRRVRKDRPDLHARVLRRELSPHAAAVEAGFRPRTVSVRLDDAAAILRTLTRHVPDDVLAELWVLSDQLRGANSP